MSAECPYDRRQPPIRIGGYFASPRTFPRSLLASIHRLTPGHARSVIRGVGFALETRSDDAWA